MNGTITEKYLWEDLTTLLAIYDGNNNLIRRFEYADGRMPISMTDASGKRYYLHYDQVGSLRAISRVLSPDNTLKVVKEITYDTYGNIINDTNRSLKVPFGFAGGLYDPDTKLTHFGYREYDAYTGKWTAKDPIGFAGGDSNLYGYVWADPVRHIDPSGQAVDTLDNPLMWPVAIGYGLYLLGDAISDSVSDLIDDITSCQDDRQNCPPCKTITGKIVPVGTKAYRPLDVLADDQMQHGVYGSHHNIFVAKQNPNNCQCFWQKQKYVLKPEQLTSDMIPIEPFAN